MSRRNGSVSGKQQSDQHPSKAADEWVVSGDTIKAGKISWLLPQRIPNAALTILEGEKGHGKSTFAGAVAAAVTRGKPLLGKKKGKPANVLWLSGETDIRLETRPRLEALGCDMKRVKFLGEDDRGIRRRLLFPAHTGVLRELIDRWELRLVVIDPLASFIEAGFSLLGDQTIHQALDPLADVAHVTECPLCIIRHLTKDRTAASIDRGQGGAAVAGLARSILRIDWPDERTFRRVLRWVRGNNAVAVGPVEFKLSGDPGTPILTGFKQFEEEPEDREAEQLDSGERDALENAKTLLRAMLNDEWITSTAISAEAERAVISPRTLRRAKRALGVRHRRNGRSVPACWEWGPPKEGWE